MCYYGSDKLQRPEDLQRIASDKGFLISENQGLGNCMFYALVEQLQIVNGIEISHEELSEFGAIPKGKLQLGQSLMVFQVAL